MEHRNLTSLSKLLASQPMKKMITQLLVSISILISLVFSYSSLPLLYAEKLNYFSSNSFRLLSLAMNKNCIFLICNGLLVFLAKTSGFVASPPSGSGFDPNDMLQKKIGDGLQICQEETRTEPLSGKDVTLEESGESKEEENNEEAEEFKCPSTEWPQEVSIFIAESDEEAAGSDENESRNCWLFHEEEEENPEEDTEDKEFDGGEFEDETEMLSTEELNQKFEDFIRRMKQEIWISETRQQLIMAN